MIDNTAELEALQKSINWLGLDEELKTLILENINDEIELYKLEKFVGINRNQFTDVSKTSLLGLLESEDLPQEDIRKVHDFIKNVGETLGLVCGIQFPKFNMNGLKIQTIHSMDLSANEQGLLNLNIIKKPVEFVTKIFGDYKDFNDEFVRLMDSTATEGFSTLSKNFRIEHLFMQMVRFSNNMATKTRYSVANWVILPDRLFNEYPSCLPFLKTCNSPLYNGKTVIQNVRFLQSNATDDIIMGYSQANNIVAPYLIMIDKIKVLQNGLFEVTYGYVNGGPGKLEDILVKMKF